MKPNSDVILVAAMLDAIMATDRLAAIIGEIPDCGRMARKVKSEMDEIRGVLSDEIQNVRDRSSEVQHMLRQLDIGVEMLKALSGEEPHAV